MMCLSIGIAVSCLLGFHLFLSVTSQTTIEFHGNVSSWRRARHRGLLWSNPYDLGWRRNLQNIWGESLTPLALLPSTREPEYLPLPLPGPRGKRESRGKKEGGVGDGGGGGGDGGGLEMVPNPFEGGGGEEEDSLLRGRAAAKPSTIEV
ncbi:hypothetical protein TeGR_g6669 [Tetraparma gracilis]|uniref:Protein S-acyltransferase n=1 Tax=Tetraparma gracilis TaxID=2962635 RepID=A0ABQ6M7Q3_9STRA|nr:hypothetical protein TeGR_g6669 [Tetraparma gracilis]